MSGFPSCGRGEQRTVEEVFRDHIASMHKYANELAGVLGRESPIVERIHSCAHSCREALGYAQAIEARRVETTKIGSVEDESAVPTGCAQKGSQ